jgi:flagellar basal-body rod modification protein FlgD
MTTIQSSGGSAISNDLMATMNAKATTSTNGTVAADEDKFLKLLVTQLKNQDPLNPLDNAQITSQLAQLSTVTGVNKLNTTLESLKSSYQSSEALQAANMIGHGVLAAGNTMTLTDGKAVLGVELGSAADSVQIAVTNGAGKVVHTIDVGAGAAGTMPLVWDGKDDDGVLLANGNYSYAVTAKQGGKALTDAYSLALGTVGSVSTNAQGVKLNVTGLGAIAMSDVKQIL